MDLILSEVSGQREYYCLFKHQYVREEFPVYICCFAHGKAVFGVSKQSIKEIDKKFVNQSEDLSSTCILPNLISHLTTFEVTNN